MARNDRQVARFAVSAPALVLAVMLAACDRAPSPAGLSQWSPADHDGEKTTKSSTQGPRGDAGAVDLVDLAWQRQCMSCHGPGGRGDGPQAPMYKPRDLGDPAWQEHATDADIASAIRNGKGKMPRFELPDAVVTGLVARVRSFRSRTGR